MAGTATAMNLGRLLTQTARRVPDRAALVWGERRWTWAELNARVDRLAAAPKARVQALASSVHLSQSALSRVVARLERDGLVERAMCPDDRRGIFVAITPDGRARHAEAAPTRQRVLTEHLSGPSQENHEGCVCLS